MITGSTFRLADRVKIQCEKIRRKDYTVFGRLTAVVWEEQKDTTGLSQSRPRYTSSDQVRQFDDAVAKRMLTAHQADALKPFSEVQNRLWQSLTIDWLGSKKGPLIARSKDGRDVLLPEGLAPLPPIPHPHFVPAHAVAVCAAGGCKGCIAPRIPQLYVGCPVVGDRVSRKITTRSGYTMGVIPKITELSIVVWTPDGQGHFARLRGSEDNVDRSRPALLLDDEGRGFFVGGIFA